MSNGLLEILRYFLLALLWLFFLYAARMVLVDVQRSKKASVPTQEDDARDHAEHNRGLRLRIVDPKHRRGETTRVVSEVTLGRSPTCTISLDEDAFASSLHARVFVADGIAYLEDLGSKNGTYINEEPIDATTLLERGDLIRVGGTVLEVRR